MNFRRQIAWIIFAILLTTTFAQVVSAQSFDKQYYESMRWRCIGPFRGGRTVGAVGIPDQPNVFFIGVNNGGVWKTTDAGRTWQPIFDDAPTGSVGDIAVSPSNPDIIYVGSGEGLQRPDLSTGDGIYKTTDGGKTWKNMGLRDAQQIGGLALDPKNPNRIFVAALGHPYGANEERGVYRSLDGGATWQRVLYKDENTGAVQVEIDPQNPNVIYADLWQARQGPWENGAWQGAGSGLYKSTDGGDTWQQLTKGLPTIEQGLGRIGIGISYSNPKIIYATVDANSNFAGIYRSDDAGASWMRVSGEARLWGRGSDFAEVRPHPKNPDIVFVANTASYKSTDGGKTWVGLKGAPGGDDYHRIWINPEHPEMMIFAADQGATITVNDGETWSSWYNQATAQMYHVSTDNRWPYWVYSGQQESGSAAVVSRGDYGAITWRDWRTVGGDEYGYITPDPLNPDITYGGRITRYDWKTGQVQNIAPEALRSGKYRSLRTMPSIFSPVDKKTLYFATNVLWKTMNGGNSWEIVSPDLSRATWDVPANIGVYRTEQMKTMPRRGVIYAIAPSHQSVNTIWAGTDDGLIHLTRDGGKNWKNVTPPDLPSWAKVSQLDASHFDNDTVYAAINTFRLDDLRPHIYCTHDGGKTWKQITNGIPNGGIVNVVREDSQRKGLLFAGTEQTVYFSVDDGEHWQSLRNNLPPTSIRDLVVKDDDVVIGTHGRSFWILDDITPLRQLNAEIASSNAFLFKPQTAIRVRRSLNTDTPIPPEEPLGQNPPDGAIINYWLKADTKEVTLEILDKQNRVVRRYASNDVPEKIDEKSQPYPMYWARPQQILQTRAGMQRWIWDLHYPPPEGLPRNYGMQALLRDTPTVPFGATASPGEYTVKLTVDGKSFTQLLILKMDPRVTVPAAELAKSHTIALSCYEGVKELGMMQTDAARWREQLQAVQSRASNATNAVVAFDKKLSELIGRTAGLDFFGVSNREPGIAGLRNGFLSLMNLIEGADTAPTTQAAAAHNELRKALNVLLPRWNDFKTKDVQALNDQLVKAGLPALK